MISNSTVKPSYISFKAEKDALGGTAFQPKRDVEIKSMEDHHISPDKVLRLNALQNFKLGVKKVTYDIPKSIVRGLQGDKSVSFHEFLQMAALPYYLGGAMLYNCFRQGGDRTLAKKQGLGVVFYYSGMALANNFVDSFVKHKYGVDLNLKYRNEKGEIRKVFESVDFTRWDLLTDKDWEVMGDRLGIPRDVPDRDTSIKEEVHKILVRARAWKLVLGATFAATGAGFLARSETWNTLLANNTAFKTAFKNIFAGNTGKPVLRRLGEFKTQLFSTVKSEVIDKLVTAFKELPKTSLKTKFGTIPTGKIAIAALIALPLLAIINLIKSPNKNKVYLTKAEAMPLSSKVDQDAALRQHLENKINPNNVDYEALYNKIATAPVAPVQPNQAQVNYAPSPYDVFEAFMRGGRA